MLRYLYNTGLLLFIFIPAGIISLYFCMLSRLTTKKFFFFIYFARRRHCRCKTQKKTEFFLCVHSLNEFFTKLDLGKKYILAIFFFFLMCCSWRKRMIRVGIGICRKIFILFNYRHTHLIFIFIFFIYLSFYF